MDALTLGTRGSDLALAQSRMVHRLLSQAHPGLQVTQRIITTTGDASAAMPLHEPTAEGAGLFTRQLEEALLSGGIDLAVHSLKDLPVEAPPGLVLAAILPRASTEDLLISRKEGGLAALPPGAVVGTSSPRRALLLKKRRPDLTVIPIRGNVPTRLAKLAAGSGGVAFDAIILAAAGLSRLGHDLSSAIAAGNGMALFPEVLDWMLPAPGQGAIAVETREADRAPELVRALHDEVTERCVLAERLVLKHLGGGCHLALGALATEEKGMLSLRAVFLPGEDASAREASASAPDPVEAARLVADQLLSR